MIGFYLFKLLEKLLMLLSHKKRRAFFLFLSKIAYLLASKHKRIIRQNIEFIMPNTLSEEQIVSYSKFCFDNLLLNFLQLLEGQYSDPKVLFSSVKIEGFDIIQEG